jgi:hypothetical protein
MRNSRGTFTWVGLVAFITFPLTSPFRIKRVAWLFTKPPQQVQEVVPHRDLPT